MLGLGTIHWNPLHYVYVTDATLFDTLGALIAHAQVLARFQEGILSIHFAYLALVVFPQVLEGRGGEEGSH